MLGLENLKLSISNLFDEFGSADTQLAIVINLGLASIGVVLWLVASGWLAWVGAIWATLNVLPVVQWVIGL